MEELNQGSAKAGQTTERGLNFWRKADKMRRSRLNGGRKPTYSEVAGPVSWHEAGIAGLHRVSRLGIEVAG
jgi:hypothetical protein